MRSWVAPRILMTSDAVGGVWSYATSLCSALAERGCEILLVTLGPAPQADQVASVSGRARLGLVQTDYALEWMDPEGRDAEKARNGLARIADAFKPDLVHLNGFREAVADWDAPILVAAHSCVWTWWQACRGSRPDEPRWSTYAGYVRRALDLADEWIAPTEAFRAAVERTYEPAARGRVIYNGVEQPRASTPEKKHFILAAGRLWDEAKNIAALRRIAVGLDWPVKLAGSDDGESCEDGSSAESLGRMPHQELLAVIARAAIYASPALYEPFGLSVLEAASSGCALVLSNIPSYRELWEDSALFVDPHDDDELRTTLQLVCAKHDLRERLRSQSRRRAQHFALDTMVAAYLAAYRRILRGSSTRSNCEDLFPSRPVP